jgi:cytochrome P450
VSRPATRITGTHHQVSAAVSALPVTVIAELLGLPAADRELFRSWTDRLFASDMADPNDPELARKIDESTADMVTYLGEHCADRRALPREDLISRLAAVEADGERLTDEDMVNFSIVVLIAGHITTTALLGNTVLCLDEHPEVWARLQSSRPAMYRSPSDDPDRIPAPAQCASAVRVR